MALDGFSAKETTEIKEFGRDVSAVVDILMEAFAINNIGPGIGVSAMLTIVGAQLNLSELKTTEERKAKLAKLLDTLLMIPNTKEALGDDIEAT